MWWWWLQQWVRCGGGGLGGSGLGGGNSGSLSSESNGLGGNLGDGSDLGGGGGGLSSGGGGFGSVQVVVYVFFLGDGGDVLCSSGDLGVGWSDGGGMA